jgi:hypothetical protein
MLSVLGPPSLSSLGLSICGEASTSAAVGQRPGQERNERRQEVRRQGYQADNFGDDSRCAPQQGTTAEDYVISRQQQVHWKAQKRTGDTLPKWVEQVSRPGRHR